MIALILASSCDSLTAHPGGGGGWEWGAEACRFLPQKSDRVGFILTVINALENSYGLLYPGFVTPSIKVSGHVFQVLSRLGKMTEEETKKRLRSEVSDWNKNCSVTIKCKYFS